MNTAVNGTEVSCVESLQIPFNIYFNFKSLYRYNSSIHIGKKKYIVLMENCIAINARFVMYTVYIIHNYYINPGVRVSNCNI